mgnify:FL=1
MSANDIRELENLDRIPAEEVLELKDPDGDQSGDSGDGDGENAVPQRNNRRGKLV